jgi:hypothetical protein
MTVRTRNRKAKGGFIARVLWTFGLTVTSEKLKAKKEDLPLTMKLLVVSCDQLLGRKKSTHFPAATAEATNSSLDDNMETLSSPTLPA